MRRIIFPCTNRVHEARQKLLLDELRKDFEVDVFQPNTKNDGDLATYAILCAVEFNNYIAGKRYDCALIRADRFELLLIAGICAYRGVPVAHIEAGADSGDRVIDTRVRHAISQLADIYFVTDENAKKTTLRITAGSDRIFNVGSLDVSFANIVKPRRLIEEEYILLLHHSIPGEDSVMVYEAIEKLGYKIVGVKSNSDYGQSLMHEEYSPEDFISLMYYAKCMVGNSSALCKEISILGTPGVLVGTRQDGRIIGHNVMRSPHSKDEISLITKWQASHGRYKPDYVYYQKSTERKIVNVIKKFT